MARPSALGLRSSTPTDMLRICKYCGAQYDGDPGGSCCPDCAAAQRKTSLRPRICTVCGASFMGGPSALYCPPCRWEKRKETDRRHKKTGAKRPLGSVDKCQICGKDYVVIGSRQKFCPECAAEAIRANDRKASLRWNRRNTTPKMRREDRQRASAPIQCAVCGKTFVPHDASITCSPECSRALHKERLKKFEAEHRDELNAYQRDRRKQLESAMTPEEYAAYREKINAKAREYYHKRKAKEDQ